MEKQLAAAITNLSATIFDSIQKALLNHPPQIPVFAENTMQLPQNQPRVSRTTSRSRTPLTSFRKNQRSTTSGLSYAAALSRSASKPDTIRNIRAISTEQDCLHTMQQLQIDNVCKKSNIKSVQNKGAFNLTIKCSTADDAETVEKLLAEKCRDRIEINDVQQQQPQIKITGAITSVLTKDELTGSYQTTKRLVTR